MKQGRNHLLGKRQERRSQRRHGAALLHAVVVLELYLLFSFVLASWHTRVDGEPVPVLQVVYRNYSAPGGWGQSLRRFRDLRDTDTVDILVAGSSHAYRSFDPRIFAERGLRLFNMGSTNQTPLNTHYLLQRFMPGLDPELLILEVYVRTLISEDGLESFFDLSVNLPLSGEMVRMAAATGQPHAANSLVALSMSRITRPLEQAEQKDIEDEAYVPGGYCMSRESLERGISFRRSGTLRPAEKQMTHLRRILDDAERQGVAVAMVTAPFPDEHRNAIDNYEALSRRVADLADEHGVVYLDFNGRLGLRTYEHFKDTHHLNHSGVRIFNRALIDELRLRGLLPGPDAD